jgi:uncharacterized membrane protein
MKSKVLDWWLYIRASYWFIPTLMAIGAMVAAVGMVHLDTRLGDSWLDRVPWLYANQADGARALLSTVAGSMITVAGVTFSMTLLAVAHASSQIAPRLLTGFMRDRGNQFTLGTYIATFLYCLMVLRTVHAGAEGEGVNSAMFVPHLAILVAVALAVLSVLVLIYYIHHVPQSINVSNVIARVGDELVHGIECMYPRKLGDKSGEEGERKRLPGDFEANSQYLTVGEHDGYLRVLDVDSIMELTVENDLVVELYRRPGDFAVAGRPLMRVWPANRVSDETRQALYGIFSWGNERTREQDVMYSVEQLMEVLGKALSPGINDQYTAILCIDQFERALATLRCTYEPQSHRFDDNGNLRVVAHPVTHQEFIAELFGPLCNYVRDDWIARRHVVKMIDHLSELPEIGKSSVQLTQKLGSVRQALLRESMAESETQPLA